MRELYLHFFSGLKQQSFNFISYLYNEKRFISHIYTKPCASEILDKFKRLFYFQNHSVNTYCKSEVNTPEDLMIYASYLTLQ
jgi:hypothetical protein